MFEAVARLARLTAAATTDRKNMTVIDFELNIVKLGRDTCIANYPDIYIYPISM